MSAALAALRRQRNVARLCRLGPRAVAELLGELGRVHGIGRDIDERLARFAALDFDLLRAVGGDRFPPAPLHFVGGEP